MFILFLLLFESMVIYVCVSNYLSWGRIPRCYVAFVYKARFSIVNIDHMRRPPRSAFYSSSKQLATNRIRGLISKHTFLGSANIKHTTLIYDFENVR